VLAPKSLGRTWAIENPDRDVLSIVAMLNRVRGEYAVDQDRVLVTRLSDGGTFAYALGSSRPNLFGGMAPITGMLPPWLDVKKAKALPILIIHGAQDFIFPVMAARLANETLIGNGFAEVTYKELPDWSHAYNTRLMRKLFWPGLKPCSNEKSEAPMHLHRWYQIVRCSFMALLGNLCVGLTRSAETKGPHVTVTILATNVGDIHALGKSRSTTQGEWSFAAWIEADGRSRNAQERADPEEPKGPVTHSRCGRELRFTAVAE